MVKKISSETIFNIFFKIYNITINHESGRDPNWAKILDPDSNLIYMDPQH